MYACLVDGNAVVHMVNIYGHSAIGYGRGIGEMLLQMSGKHQGCTRLIKGEIRMLLRTSGKPQDGVCLPDSENFNMRMVNAGVYSASDYAPGTGQKAALLSGKPQDEVCLLNEY